MDLGIAGRWAIIAASSRGLGRACATALSAEGVNVVLNGRDDEQLQTTLQDLKCVARGEVTAVAADINDPAGRARLLAACPEPDILVTNNAGPTPADFADLSEADWHAALTSNMVVPLTLIQGVIGRMRARRFGRIVNITSAMVTTPRPHMTLSSGARAGLTAAVKALSLEVARDNVTINNLLPERIDTDRQQMMAERVARRESITMAQARQRQVESIAAKRLGLPTEFGAACAFLCSAHASYISGQNLHLDGGSYPGLV